MTMQFKISILYIHFYIFTTFNCFFNIFFQHYSIAYLDINLMKQKKMVINYQMLNMKSINSHICNNNQS